MTDQPQPVSSLRAEAERIVRERAAEMGQTHTDVSWGHEKGRYYKREIDLVEAGLSSGAAKREAEIVELREQIEHLTNERDWLKVALNRHKCIVDQTLSTLNNPSHSTGLYKHKHKVEHLIISLEHFQGNWKEWVMNDLTEMLAEQTLASASVPPQEGSK